MVIRQCSASGTQHRVAELSRGPHRCRRHVKSRALQCRQQAVQTNGLIQRDGPGNLGVLTGPWHLDMG